MPKKFSRFTEDKNYTIKPKQKVALSDEHFNLKCRDMNRDHRAQRVKELLNENLTFKEIAATFGITEAAFRQWAHANNLSDFPEFKDWEGSYFRKNERKKRTSKRQQPIAAGNYILRRFPELVIPKKVPASCRIEFDRWLALANKANMLRQQLVRLLEEENSSRKGSMDSMVRTMLEWEDLRPQTDSAWKDYAAALHVRERKQA
jgi:transposase-like protein